MLCKTFRIRTTVGGGHVERRDTQTHLAVQRFGFVVAAVLTLTLNTWSHWGLGFRVQVPNNQVPGIWVIVIIVQVLVIRI